MRSHFLFFFNMFIFLLYLLINFLSYYTACVILPAARALEALSPTHWTVREMSLLL